MSRYGWKEKVQNILHFDTEGVEFIATLPPRSKFKKTICLVHNYFLAQTPRPLALLIWSLV